MNNNGVIEELPFGLIELDEAGTVIYYKPKNDDLSANGGAEIVGRNFFTDITPVAESREFQSHIKSFRQSHAPAESFNFTFDSSRVKRAVRVLLARIHEQSGEGGVESILIHIKPEGSESAL